jgi:hypothetical protein
VIQVNPHIFIFIYFSPLAILKHLYPSHVHKFLQFLFCSPRGKPGPPRITPDNLEGPMILFVKWFIVAAYRGK